ncbi:MAG: entericidin A/B family lipoprotein [Verrucomicrobiales bacterium]
MKHLIAGFLVAVALSSCNTVIGMGRDFRQLGEGMENAANGRGFSGDAGSEQETLPTY